MKNCPKTAVILLLALTFATCKEGVDNPKNPDSDGNAPTITVKLAGTIPADGCAAGSVEVAIADAEGLDVLVTCDGEVVTSASYVEPRVVFGASVNDTAAEREGWITISVGNTSERIELTQDVCSIYKYTGWAELPSMGDNSLYERPLIFYAHDKLPSDASKRNYSFCYAPEHCAALWVAYPLHDCYVGDAKRTDAFGYDYEFMDYTGSIGIGAEELQSNSGAGAYYPSGGGTYSHSRGHQLPSADRTATREDNRTTFYATNMTPQLQALNGGAWEKLESLVRNNWMCADTLYVVTGAIYEEGYGYAYDEGGNGKAVSVPTHYYKALLRTKAGDTGKRVADCAADELECIGFIFAHDSSRTKQTVYTTDACSVAELESRTGFTFFTNVPRAPKGSYDTSAWSGLSQQQ